MSSNAKNIGIQVNTHPDPLQFTFVLLIEGREPVPEDGILSTTWNLGDGTVYDDFDLEIEYTYTISGSYAVAVDVTFEGDGKEEKDKKQSSKDPDVPPTSSTSTTIVAG